MLQSSNQAAKPSGKPDAFVDLDTYGPAFADPDTHIWSLICKLRVETQTPTRTATQLRQTPVTKMKSMLSVSGQRHQYKTLIMRQKPVADIVNPLMFKKRACLIGILI